MVKWRKLDLEEFVLLLAIWVFLAFLGVAFLGMITAQPVAAQDTAPTWEYGGLIYEGESAFVFTDDLAVNNELNKVLESMGSQINIINALNVMGAAGWEYSATLRAGEGSTLYLFKRPR